jgi:CDP-diacylglycerol--serine O-phosphatidyltransferase
VPPDLVGPVVTVVVLFVALLIAYPWIILTAGTLAYLVSLPFGWLSHRGYARRARETKAEPAAAPAVASSQSVGAGVVRSGAKEERPSRLN